ncbi:MAG: hypothetical protein KDB80_00340, partial [Planctomycetes bacterium]|nr:hypothetical protein [Planctomycetota bacterium]
VYWSVAEKNGHEPFSRMLLLAALTDTGSDEEVDESLRALPYFFDEVIASYVSNPTLSRPSISSLSAPPAAGSPAYDPQNWVLDRDSVAARRAALPVTSNPGLLIEDPDFVAKQRGLGAYLGMNESLVADRHSRKIFVGSADGVVTALVPNKDTSLTIHERFGVVNASEPASLGYAVRGIVENQKWIIVALQRRLLLFARDDVTSPVAQVDLDWDEYSPKNLQLTEGLFGGSDTHLVYSSHVGEIVVRRVAPPAMPVVAWSSQPSITSLVVSDEAAAEPSYSRRMYMSTESGHVVQFCMSQQVPSHVFVTGASDRIGFVRDLTLSANPAKPGVAAIIQGSRSGGFTFASFFRQPTGRLEMDERIVLDSLPSGPMIYGSAEQCFAPQIEQLGSGIYAILIQGVLFVVGDASATQIPAHSASAVELGLLPGALYAGSMEVVDVDKDGQNDVALATESGQVMWLPGSAVLSGDLAAIEHAVLGDDWFSGAGTATPSKYGTASVSSTWGMTWGVDSLEAELQTPGTPEALQVVDQCGRRWAIDADGTPRYLHVIKDSELVGSTEYPSIRLKPFRDLAWIGTHAPSVLQTEEATFDLGASLNPALVKRSELYRPSFWQAVYLIARNPQLWLERYDGTTAGLVPWFAMRPGSGLGTGRAQPFDDGYLPFCLSGDTTEVVGAGIYSGSYGYYWNGTRLSLPGILRGFRLDDTNPLAVASTPWGSSSSNSNVTTWSIIDPPPFPNESDKQAHFRHVTATGGVFDAQSLRIGHWDSGSPLGPFPLRVIVSTMGGRVIVNNPDPALPAGQCITAESEDHGLGGLALCVEDVHGNGLSTIFAGTIFTHEGHFPGGPVKHDLVSSLHVYRLDGTAGEQLVELDSRVFDGTGSDAKLFGLCGIATGNLIDDADGIQDELILTTLNGDLVVYDLDGTGENVTIGATPLFWGVFDGSVGTCNSIVVRDPEGGGDTEGELYVATSMGVRKFTFTP